MGQDFFLQFIDEKEVEDNTLKMGRIRIGDFSELFRASLSYWSISDYLKQWEEGLYRLLFEHKQSCLVTSMYNPAVANFIFWWVLYPEGDTVHIQNHVLFLNELDTTFSLDNLYDYVSPREILSEDGNKLSEWSIGTEAIREFYDSLRVNKVDPPTQFRGK